MPVSVAASHCVCTCCLPIVVPARVPTIFTVMIVSDIKTMRETVVPIVVSFYNGLRLAQCCELITIGGGLLHLPGRPRVSSRTC